MGKNLFCNPTLAKATVISEIDSQVQFPNKKKKEQFIRIQTHLFSPKKISSLLAVFFFSFLRFASSRVLPRTSSPLRTSTMKEYQQGSASDRETQRQRRLDLHNQNLTTKARLAA
ncbi:hypothetical protein Peur_023637 [Populus x canadensis]